IMSPVGGKLSKRKADELGLPVNVRDYVEGDYEPEALVNYLVLMGWSPGDDRELFTLEEMAAEFRLDRVSKSGAIFNFPKLLWYNEHYLRQLPMEDLLPRANKVLKGAGIEAAGDYLERVLTQVMERLQRIQDLP